MNNLKLIASAALALGVVSILDSHAADVSAPLNWQHGTELMMFGSSDLTATNQYLQAYGLEAIPQNGMATVAIAPGSFPDSNYGSYSMVFAAIMAKPKGAEDSNESWFFFGLETSSRELNSAEQTTWGIASTLGLTQIDLNGNSAQMSARSHGQVFLRYKMGDAALQKQAAAYDFDVYSPTSEGIVHYHHVCEGTAYNRDFDSTLDTFWVDPSSQIGSALTAIQFQPGSWSLYYTNTGTLSVPLSTQ